MNRWYFWVLAPVMIGGAAIIALVPPGPKARPGAQLLAYAIAATLLLGTLGLANPRRFGWALRAVAGAVLLAGGGYFATELLLWMQGKPAGVFGPRSRATLWNAGLFLLVFGVPALRYLLSRRSHSIVDAIAVADDPDDPADDAGPNRAEGRP